MNNIIPDVSKLLLAATRQEILESVAGLVVELGVEYFSIMQVQDQYAGPSIFRNSGNIPAEYASDFHDPSLGKADPVMQFCKTSSLPIAWDRRTYDQHGQDGIWKRQAEVGIRSGITVATHLPHGKHFLIGVEGTRDSLGSEQTQNFMKNMLITMSIYAQSALAAIDEKEAAHVKPILSPREKECLHWTMLGKTASEIGQILDISARTVVAHLERAMRAFGVNSKIMAVMAAVHQGILP